MDSLIGLLTIPVAGLVYIVWALISSASERA